MHNWATGILAVISLRKHGCDAGRLNCNEIDLYMQCTKYRDDESGAQFTN